MPSNKTRIVFFVDILQRHFDGVSNTMHQLAARLPTDKIEPIFITTFPPDEFSFPVYECPFLSFPLYKDYRIALPNKMKDLESVLDDFKPHLIHYTSPTLFGRYAIKYAHKHDIPVTSTYHTHFYSYLEYYFGFLPPLEYLVGSLVKRLTKWFYINSTKTFVPSQPMKDFLLSIGIPEVKISFFRRGINTDHFNPDFANNQWKRDLGIEDKKIILFVSRLVKEKELDTIIRTYILFLERNPEVVFVITGDGPFKKYMEKRMPKAVFTGKQTKEQLATIYASSNVFIFPSITETFGNVVLEALASGLPAVVADAGGPKGIVTRSGGGFSVPAKDEEAFYEHISKLLNDDSLHSEMSNKAVQYANAESWEEICNAMSTELIEISQASESQKLS